ncbi:Replication initiation/membrane attachment protein (plasmid) [Acholeplasma hippikon]|uniref:Replication initiation/membrane attachment protein n=2 Tax=Acholeplasma hippikon TaxID=264636 RepID=A0A449BLQ1_9MOLU|nr:Replication initiation/membrane attachment protein [Acholeplasma hippikon]VEU83353.1 Replication initiation/membrane attachment protein [Acholeplasma hippikon]
MKRNLSLRIRQTQLLKFKPKPTNVFPIQSYDDYVYHQFLNTKDIEYFSNEKNFIHILENFSLNLTIYNKKNAIDFFMEYYYGSILPIEPGIMNCVLFYTLMSKNGHFTNKTYLSKVIENWYSIGIDTTVKAYFHMMYEISYKKNKSLHLNSLRYFRSKYNYSSMDVANFLNVPESVYLQMERNTLPLNSTQIINLCNLFKCSADDLLFYSKIFEKITVNWDV